jgi:hypothetical protein
MRGALGSLDGASEAAQDGQSGQLWRGTGSASSVLPLREVLRAVLALEALFVHCLAARVEGKPRKLRIGSTPLRREISSACAARSVLYSFPSLHAQNQSCFEYGRTPAVQSWDRRRKVSSLGSAHIERPPLFSLLCCPLKGTCTHRSNKRRWSGCNSARLIRSACPPRAKRRSGRSPMARPKHESTLGFAHPLALAAHPSKQLCIKGRLLDVSRDGRQSERTYL